MINLSSNIDDFYDYLTLNGYSEDDAEYACQLLEEQLYTEITQFSKSLYAKFRNEFKAVDKNARNLNSLLNNLPRELGLVEIRADGVEPPFPMMPLYSDNGPPDEEPEEDKDKKKRIKSIFEIQNKGRSSLSPNPKDIFSATIQYNKDVKSKRDMVRDKGAFISHKQGETMDRTGDLTARVANLDMEINNAIENFGSILVNDIIEEYKRSLVEI